MTPTLRLRKKLCETIEQNADSDFSAEEEDSDDESVCSGSYRTSHRRAATTPKVCGSRRDDRKWRQVPIFKGLYGSR